MPYGKEEQSMPKNYWPIISLLVVVLIFAVGYFIIYPEMNSLKELNIQIGAKSNEAQAMETKIAELTALKKSFETNFEETKKLDIALPQDDQMSEIINIVGSAGANSGLSITSINESKTVKGQKYTPVGIGFRGTYKSLSLFLENLRKSIRYSDPTQISITSAQNQQGENTNDVISGKIDLDFFKVNSNNEKK